jgi:3-dehydroquinate synthase
MRRIVAAFPGGRSEIRVARGLFRNLPDELARTGLEPPFLVVSQPRVLAALGPLPGGLSPLTIPDGERAKSLATVRRLLDAMVARKLSREATLVALGGGVVGDLTGFAASIYMRGLRVVQVPTTLLAQVDSSVGGKTGVNHPAGKNLIGTFHQPRLVLADPSLLASLPVREYNSGLYEALKYGVIRDRELFSRFERSGPILAAREPAFLEDLVFRCLKIKADVVLRDEREGNLRRVLNFGHTIGHGIEAALGYRRVRHGEAVGYGMIGAARIASELGRLSARSRDRIEEAVRSIGRLPALGGVSAGDVLEAMGHDKKVRRGALHFVLPTGIGRVRIEAGVPEALVKKVVRSLL